MGKLYKNIRDYEGSQLGTFASNQKNCTVDSMKAIDLDLFD